MRWYFSEKKVCVQIWNYQINKETARAFIVNVPLQHAGRVMLDVQSFMSDQHRRDCCKYNLQHETRVAVLYRTYKLEPKARVLYLTQHGRECC